MAKTKTSEIIVGLDIGTTKIAAIAGEVTDDGIDIIGIGTAPSKGLRRGVVVNIDATVSAIRAAIDEAENMAGCQISSVFAAISGAHVRGLNSHGIVAVKDKEVRDADIARVIEAAKAVAIPMDREVLHVLPQQYVIDDQDGIRDPLGMAGVRLEAKVHIVTTAVTSAQNVVKCANRCGLQVADIVLEPLASAQAVLEDDEKELGVALVDIGGGTCDIAVFADGAIVHTAVLPLGGGHVTNDIATVLRTPLDSAEKIKRKYGCASRSMIGDGDTMEVPSVGGRGPRVLPRSTLVEIIEPRVEEIFEHVKRELMRSGYADGLAAGIVLTGGATILEGTAEVAEQVLGLPVRRAHPVRIGGLVDVVRSPAYATGVGLVVYGASQGRTAAHRQQAQQASDRGLIKRAWSRLAEIF
ncbi:MAG: cell division protein FtsA [Kofleriaceae bacterium]|jgi:cell division protein FtsA|nr:cell division protein FtsA [Kofleriaceae bacterium]MBP9168775.1 cell division protein FtsA [Kofleriaceae bacterium]MBP9860110.1 cell division protein FtsA [Kofleriaceae bacterium]